MFWKYIRSASILSLLILLTNKYSHAQESWTKASPESTKISTVETTPWGILAGELDTRLWLEPFNGIFISNDLGNTWTKFCLDNRGITDIEYNQSSIFATTYYFENNTAGLFISQDGGKTWIHSGNNFSTSTVSTEGNSIYLGTYSHGLWISSDKGTNWEQKIGEGFYGPQIFKTESKDNISIAATNNQTYISNDYGNSWKEITDLNGLNVRSIEFMNQTIILGTSNENGMYRSLDNGTSWEHMEGWGETSVGAIKHYRDILYAGRLNAETQRYDAFQSKDFGLFWESTNLSHNYNNGQVSDITWLFSSPSYLFALLPYEGIFRYEIPEKKVESYPFLETPWDIKFENEYIDRIVSYFDHEYPLIHLEPQGTRSTTLNYLGNRGYEPHMFYSGHNGYDYSLNYGTPVYAAYSGHATYSYDQSFGHKIKINHLNGYSTIYAHLQSNQLITNTDIPVWADTGQQIGLIGMSGNTTGPHLHFEVIKNENTDPYGWQSQTEDPWENYTWEDKDGLHHGEKSNYLWNHPLFRSTKYIKKEYEEIVSDNKKVIIDQNSSEQNFTIFVEPYTKPIIPITQKKLTYVTGTSILINAFNNLGLGITDMLKPTKIEIDFSNADLTNIKENSLKVYVWNEETQLWEEVPSILDIAAKLIIAEILHFSHFAVLGEKIDYEPPTTYIEITGTADRGWYSSYPTVTLTANNDSDKIFYSINNSAWLEYSNSFLIDNEGINSMQFRSMDSAGNVESAKDQLIKIDTLDKWEKTLTIHDSTFVTE